MDMTAPDRRKPYITERHIQQRGKNRVVLGVIIGICLLFFVITIVKFGGAGVLPGAGGMK